MLNRVGQAKVNRRNVIGEPPAGPTTTTLKTTADPAQPGRAEFETVMAVMPGGFRIAQGLYVVRPGVPL